MSDKKEKKNPFAGIVNYFKDVRGEMKKVVWPTYKQLQKNTIIVLISIVIIGVFIWALDFGFQNALSAFTEASTQNNATTQQSTEPETQEVPAEQTPATQSNGQ